MQTEKSKEEREQDRERKKCVFASACLAHTYMHVLRNDTYLSLRETRALSQLFSFFGRSNDVICMLRELHAIHDTERLN